MKGALFGAVGAVAAVGVVNVTAKVFNMAKTAAHSSNFINSGVNKITLFKAAAHGVARGAIQSAQGGSFKAGFMSGFSSGFDVGTSAMGGNTAGGFVARTVTMGIVGGTASALGGGKFSNGAMSGAFTHMFNAEGGSIKKAFESLGRGLYRLGDYLGRITGFRDWQVDSIGLGKNYYRNQAKVERSAVYELGSHIVNNPSLSTKALSMYYNYDSAQMDTNSLVNFYTGLVVPGVGAMALSGNIMGEAHEINQIYNNLRN